MCLYRGVTGFDCQCALLRALQWVACRFGSGKAEGSSGFGGVSAEEERLWRKWVDERFVKVLTANIYRSWE